MNQSKKDCNTLTCGHYSRVLGTNKGKGLARTKTSTKPLPEKIVNRYQVKSPDLDRGQKEYRQ